MFYFIIISFYSRQVGGGGSEGEQSDWWSGFGAKVSCKAPRHCSSSQQTVRLQEQTTCGAVSDVPGYSFHSNLSMGWNKWVIELNGDKIGWGVSTEWGVKGEVEGGRLSH